MHVARSGFTPSGPGQFPSFRIVESLSSNGPGFTPFGKPLLICFSGRLSEHRALGTQS